MNHIFEFIHVYKLYKLILFSLTRKLCQIMYTNVFNDHSHKIITRYQWSHEFLLLISFFWQNLTSRFNINTEAALRRCSFERLFCECAANLRGRAGVQQSCICSVVGVTLPYRCSPMVFASHLRNIFLKGIIASGCLLLSKNLLLMTQFL